MRIGLIGCGKQAPKHISGLRQDQRVEIVLADQDAERAERLGKEADLAWTSDVTSLFSDPQIAAIDIATPTPSHAPLVRQSIAAGKDFFCEKPLCDNAREARELCDLATAAGRIGMVGYIYRFAPVFEQAHRLCQTSQESSVDAPLGKLVAAFMRIGGRGSHQPWKHRTETGGGAINEMLVHMLDLAVWFFGPVREARLLRQSLLRPQREIQGIMEQVDAEDYVVANFTMAAGLEVLIQADLTTPGFSQSAEIQGDNGSFYGSIQPNLPASLFCDKAAGDFKAGHTDLTAPVGNLFLSQMSAFLAAVRDQKQPTRCGLQASVEVLEGLEMLRASGTAST